MTEIARACGVSQATVSLVVNNAPGTRISAKTRETVLTKAQELGYSTLNRNPGRRPVIGMLINDVISSPHVAGLIDGVTDAANELGFLVAMIPTRGGEEVEEAAISHLLNLPAAGVIYARLITQKVRVPDRLRQLPLMLLNCYEDTSRLPSVVPADLAAGLTATLALLDAGHRRIGFIAGEDIVEASRDRLKGYKRALAMRDRPYDPKLVVKSSWSIAGGYLALGRMLALEQPPTAVFCFCDRAAVGAYTAASEAGLKVGETFSVIGFDNEDFSADMLPPLTTMELPHADMARHAVEQLAAIIANPAASPSHMRQKFDCPMVVRSSVA